MIEVHQKYIMLKQKNKQKLLNLKEGVVAALTV